MAPIRTLAYEVLGAVLNDPNRLQSKGPETDRIFRVVMPPFVIGDFAQRLRHEFLVVGLSQFPVHQQLGRHCRILRHQVIGPEDGTNHLS